MIKRGSNMSTNLFGKVCVIMGSTGSGKSSLSLRLAQRLDGEIVNADSMQFYKGLTIGTAKLPPSERCGIPHHLIDFLDDDQVPYSVSRYVQDALRVIADVRARGKTPIVVGGTVFYVQSLLFGGLSFEHDEGKGDDQWSAEAEGAASHKELAELDPELAATLHPNDVRRVRNAIQRVKAVGSQLSTTNIGVQSNPRFPNECVVFWTRPSSSSNDRALDQAYSSFPEYSQAHAETLKDRINIMVDDGIVDEAKAYLARAEAARAEAATAETTTERRGGLEQAMGYKEFQEYLRGNETLEDAKQKLLHKHVRYSKYQAKWVRKKLLGQNHVRVYSVYPEARDALIESCASSPHLDNVLVSENATTAPTDAANDNERRECCGLVLIGRKTYDAHVAGKRHRAMSRNPTRKRVKKNDSDE